MTIDSGLATAARAIELPEVQELVKQLAAYGLGVSLPHMHDQAGNMVPLPEGVVQVEDDDLRASFVPADQVVGTPDRQYLTVGWRWSETEKRASGTTHCPMAKDATGKWYHTGAQRTN